MAGGVPSLQDHLTDSLSALCALSAPSGREEAVRDWLRERWRDRTDALATDGIGNLLARVGGTGPRVAIVAHMDEIGYVVRHISADGFVFLDTAQGDRRDGPKPRHVIGHPAQLLGRDGVVATGVFATVTGHVATQAQLESARLGWDDFFVDLGLGSRAEVEALGVHPGLPVVLDGDVRRVGTRLVGKAMDDRALLAALDALIAILDRDALACELWLVATVQEENGLHGAKALAARRRLDLAVVLDIGLVGDIPSTGAREYEPVLGGGPVIVHKDAAVAYDAALSWHLLDLAARDDLPTQHGVVGHGVTDGVALIDAGIPTALVAIPTRYTHSPFEMIDPLDLVALVRLLSVFVQEPLLNVARASQPRLDARTGLSTHDSPRPM